jgi:hypothetical protein
MDCSEEREIETYIVYEISRGQSGLITRRYDFFEGRLNGKGLFNPHTIGERETGRSGRRTNERGARPMGWNRFFEDE